MWILHLPLFHSVEEKSTERKMRLLRRSAGAFAESASYRFIRQLQNPTTTNSAGQDALYSVNKVNKSAV
jgi:hypothetical protein